MAVCRHVISRSQHAGFSTKIGALRACHGAVMSMELMSGTPTAT